MIVLLGGDPDPSVSPPRSIKDVHAGAMPSDWFLRQRAWPHEEISQTARLAAAEQARGLRALARQRSTAGFWDPVGPTNIGGRIADVACHPTDPNTIYVGAAEGGVFKTTDAGATWIPTFDDESSLSIGSVAIDPTNPEVLYVGTGEANGGGGSVTYGGTGVFKSTNGGATWKNVGLAETRYIGRVVVDPSSPNRVFVAALGAMFSTGPDRGVYRSTDAGVSWERVLASNDSTGAIDLAIHPSDSNRVYAAMWERTRGPDYLNYGGDGSGIWRTTDGGDTWTELTNGLPSGPDVGRIGISLADSSPDILYAIYADASPGEFDGVYKTTDGGSSWIRTNDGALSGVYATYGWWFGNIRVDPVNPNRVFVLGLTFYRSTNGGSSWAQTGSSMHVDHHGLDFTPGSTAIWEGNDGGMYRSTNGGTIWTHFANMPVTQFYIIEVDEQIPYRRYGGTQDNGTNRTRTGAPDDWENLFWGDGFHCLVDPTNNNYIYVESQWGNLQRSTNGGSSFSWIGGDLSGRKNWSMPVVMDPSNPQTLYAGTHRLYRTTNRGSSWTAISGDLTDGPGSGNVTYGTITTIAVASTDGDVLLAGTDDGNVHVTTNGGGVWTRVDATLPERWITRVVVDPLDDAVNYVTISGFRWDDPLPHVFRSTNHGASWTDISSNLPEAPVNDLVVDPQDTDVLYVGTDFGAYRTTNGGASWASLGLGLPNVVVNDLELHNGTRTLTAGTYGRSLWTYDLTFDPTDAGEVIVDVLPPEAAPRLLPIRPNPVIGGRATVRFALSHPADVSVRVYDVTGRRVADLARGRFSAGTHALGWDGRDLGGTRVASGLYLVRLEGDGVARVRKVALRQ